MLALLLPSEWNAIYEPTTIWWSPISTSGADSGPITSQRPSQIQLVGIQFPFPFLPGHADCLDHNKPCPSGRSSTLGRQGWIWNLVERLSAFPSWRLLRKHSVGHRKQTAEPRAQAKRADFRHWLVQVTLLPLVVSHDPEDLDILAQEARGD